MKYIKLLVLSAFLLIYVSCDFILDIDPSTYVLSPDTYYETEEQLEIALRGVYAVLAEDGLYGNFMLGRMGLEADEGFETYSPDMGGVGYYAVSQNDPKILAYWQMLYAGINRANLLLDNIEKPELIGETKRNHIKGQALFLRAYYYFMLVNKFGDVPLVLEPTTSKKVTDLQVPRTPIKDVYEKIIEDMTLAEGLVLDIDMVESPGRVSKSAVQGILARVCLYMAGCPVNDESKYELAANWAYKVIISRKHQLNTSYEQIFINYAQDKYDSKESIWEVEFWGNGQGVYNTTGGMVGRNNGIVNTEDYDMGYSLGMVNATAWLYKLYDASDKRRDWAITPYSFKGNPSEKRDWTSSQLFERDCGKYRREYELLFPKSRTRTPINFPILRYSDVLLMLAEAINEQYKGPSTTAHLAINQVRRRGYGLPINQSNIAVDLWNLSYTDFKNEIMDERARELCFEALRKNDLVRWGIFHSRMKAILPSVPEGATVWATSAKQIFTNASPRDTIWPIPFRELGVNKKLVQNAGW